MSLTKEDLQAIGDLIENRLQPMKGLQESIQRLDSKVDNVKEELQTSIQRLDSKVDSVKEELQESIRHLDVKVENSYDKIYNLLKEDYTPVAAAARGTAEKVSDYEELKDTVSAIKDATQQHNERITALEKQRAI